jgi:hypothetical protein
MSTIRRKLGPLTLDIPAVIVGVQILLKGWEKVADFGHHPFLVSLLLFLGGFVMVGAFLTLWLEKRIENAHALFHAAEGIAMSLSAIVLLEKGRVRIPLLLLFAGLCYLVIGIVESRTASQRARLAGPMVMSFGCAFLAAGLILAGVTALHDRNAWALGVAGILVAIGATFLLRRRAMTAALSAAGGHAPEADAR